MPENLTPPATATPPAVTPYVPWSAGPRPPHGGVPPLPPPAPAFAIRDYLAIGLRHWRVVLGVAVLVMLAAWIRIRDELPQFRASAVIRLADAHRALAGGLASDAVEAPQGSWIDPILTQIQLMRSRALLTNVVDSVGFRLRSTTPGFYVGHLTDVHVAPDRAEGTVDLRFLRDRVVARAGTDSASAPYGAPVALPGVRFVVPTRPVWAEATLAIRPRDVAINEIAQAFNARPREMTSVIDLTVTVGDPYLAARAVNGIAAALQSSDAANAQARSRRRRIFLEGQLRTTDSTLRVREAELAGHRRREQSYSAREEFTRSRTEIAALDQTRREVTAAIAAHGAIIARLAGGGAARREALREVVYGNAVTSSPAVQQFVLELARLDRARDSLTTGSFARSETHPDVRRTDGLIAATEQRLDGALRAQLASLEASRRALDAERTAREAAIARLPDAEEQESALLREADNVRRVAARLSEELQLARIAEAVEAGTVQIVDLAAHGEGPVGAGRRRKLLFAALFGLLAGGVAALFADRLNASVRDTHDLEARAGLPCLGVVSRVGRPRGVLAHVKGPFTRTPAPPAGEALSLDHVDSWTAEAFRTLMTNLLFWPVGTALRSIVVTSALAEEGKTTTAAHLAAAFARQGRRVVIVDADIRRARLHQLLDGPREPGLTGVLSGSASLDAALVETRVPGLTLLPAGRTTPNPLKFLASEAMTAVLSELRARYDVVIVDTAPVLAAADTSALVGQVDGVVFIVRSGRTHHKAARRAVQQVSDVGGRIVGGVLNDADERLAEYTGYYNYYGNYGTTRSA